LLSSGSFKAMGTLNTVVVADEAALPAAMDIVKTQIEEIENACSRFRPDSELSRLNRRAGGDPVLLSPLLEKAIVAALDAAEMTDGLVDLTVGRNVEEAGYTVTFRDLPADGPAIQLLTRRVAGWRSLTYDPGAHTLRVPAGVAIDLGASGKAWAADRSATAVADKLGVSVVVECGGDIAVGGPLLEGGWPVRVAVDEEAADGQDILVFDGGLATSGTSARRWRRGGIEMHHIIDPSTGLPAQTPWAMVSAAAATCVEANAAATAALIMGEHAIEWLNSIEIPSRLVAVDGQVHYAGSWSA
jgi:thiamine biosynthesis lipoprotein ApbE